MIQYFQEYSVSLKKALVVISFFKGIELIRNSSCNHLFDEWLSFYKTNCNHSFLQIYCVFAEKELQQGDIIYNNYYTSLV